MRSQLPIILALLSAISGLVSAVPTNMESLHEKRKCKCSADLVNELLFESDMKTFQQRRDDKDPACCDWSSDGCSQVSDKPGGYKFLSSCQRHDFGYRNFKDLDKLSEDMRQKVDDQFKEDMFDVCDKAKGNNVTECKDYADAYYLGVRACGGGGCDDIFDIFN